MSRLEYCAQAEPRLRKMPSDPIAAFTTLKRLAGPGRFDADYLAAQKPPAPGRDPGLFAVECFETAHPQSDILHRVYSGHSCKRAFGSVGFGHGGETCGCLVCDLARELDLLAAVAAAEKATK